MGKNSFTDLLKRQGYEVSNKKLGGGFVNNVQLITAYKGNQVYEYVLKKYGSEKDIKDMLRGYDAISSVVKTPTIVYHQGKEVAYDLVKGKSLKDMLLEHDPKAPGAIKLLGQELEKLHRSKNAPPQYKHGNSPDERKMIQHVVKALQNEQISEDEANKLLRQIREYIPKNKSLVHGDAHLGNFMYSNEELYFIDPDNVKISDFNADIGKVVHAIERLGDEGKISPRQADELGELFLAKYNGEDPRAVNLYMVRTPLIELKRGPKNFARKTINKWSSLEAKVAAFIVIFVGISFIFLSMQNNFTGLVIGEIAGSSNLLIGVLIIIVGLIIYFILKNKQNSFSKNIKKSQRS